MKKKLFPISLLIISSQFSGCASHKMEDETICFNDQGMPISCADIEQESNNLSMNIASPKSKYMPRAVMDPSLFNSRINFIVLNEYVEQMAIKLQEQTNPKYMSSPVAVTSLVTLDSTLENTSLLGNQISEYFINELKGVGYKVSDHKVTGHIKVTSNGDMAMSRDIQKLKHNLSIGSVLTGTMIQNQRGMVINVRIVSLETNRVIASTTKLIPRLIVNEY